MRRLAVAVAVIVAGLLGTGTAIRLARPGDVDALAAAALAAGPERGTPGLIVVVDPACAACAEALEELREVVRPGDLGLRVRVLGREGDGGALLEAAGPGLVPLFLVVDAAGYPVATLRGPRPPALLRAWLEEAVARALANRLDRGAARGPPWKGGRIGPPAEGSMTRRIQLLALGLALAAPVRAADVAVLGCNEMLPGRIGVGELVADIGDTVGVEVTVHTLGEVGAFGLDVAFPAGVLGYVRTDLGELVAGWSVASGTLEPAQGVVRIDGFDGAPIPEGVTGRLAVMFFVVEAAGSGSFATVGLAGDLAGYTPCERLHAPTHIRRETWGKVKELYK